uniref:Coiled-coil serine rich protein 2 n=1 Tax=Ornithorhynchus anatinus TaxID=9258 RepID=A0A6I8N8G3_ORNAN
MRKKFSVDCDNMNRFDRSDRNGRQQQEGFWKRTPQRWRGQEHYHLGHTEHFHHGETDNRRSPYLESPVGHFENYGKTNLYQASRPVMGLPENTVMLDEMTLRHMVQDCTAVKTQLLKLKRLLHQNDENDSLQEMQLSLPPSPEVEDVDPVYKTEDLLNEIKQLKEEVKKKDETIKQLEHQLTVGCNCQKESPKSKGDKCILLDKYTQTSWRRSSGGYSAPSFSPWQGPIQGIPRTVPPHRRQTSSTTAFQQPSQFHRPRPGKTNKATTYRGPQ